MGNTPTTDSAIAGVILAGGKARRLGGQDKGLVDLCGRPLIEYSIQALAPQVQPLLISANRNLEQYRTFGYAVIEDNFGSYEGPLAGLWRALQATQNPILAALPCDAPLAPGNFVTRLRTQFNPGQTLAAIAHDGKRLQPLFGLFSRDVLPSLTIFLEQGGRKVQAWVNSLKPVHVDFSDCPQAFQNINTPEDLDIVRKDIRCQRTP